MHLRCDMHMKDNIKSKLSSLGVPPAVGKEYMVDIFGQEGEAGLVHCQNGTEFDRGLQNLKTVWEKRHAKGSDFYLYFIRKKASAIRKTMTAGVRSMCGLGFPPDVYTQNASEAMNKIVREEDKDDGSSLRKRKTVCDIVERLRKLVERQEQEQFLAVLGKGEYKVAKGYRHLEVGDDYYRMTERQKEALRKEFFTCKQIARQTQTVDDDEISEFTSPPALSVQPENTQIITVPYSVLKELFAEAGRILHSQNSLVQSPAFTLDARKEDLWFVASKEEANKPHSVKVSDTGQVTCVQWARHNICSHTVAVAEKVNMLSKYLQRFRNRRKTGTLSKMAEVGAPKTSGQKNKATQRRKGRSNAKVTGPLTVFPQHSRIPPSDQLPVGIQQNSNLPTSLPVQLNTIPLQVPPLSLPLLIPQHPDGFSPTTQGPTQKPDPPPGLAEVTLLHLCDPRVSVCHGCSQPIRSAGTHVPPPADMVVVSKMRHEYTVVGERRQGKMGNVYFHANLTCIKKKVAHFMPSLLTVQRHVRLLLTPLHEQHLIDSIGFSA